MWALASSYLLIHLIIETYWTINEPNIESLQRFEFVSLWIQVILFYTIAGMNLLSASHLRLLQKHMLSQDKIINMNYWFVWLLFAIYFFMGSV